MATPQSNGYTFCYYVSGHGKHSLTVARQQRVTLSNSHSSIMCVTQSNPTQPCFQLLSLVPCPIVLLSPRPSLLPTPRVKLNLVYHCMDVHRIRTCHQGESDHHRASKVHRHDNTARVSNASDKESPHHLYRLGCTPVHLSRRDGAGGHLQERKGRCRRRPAIGE